MESFKNYLESLSDEKLKLEADAYCTEEIEGDYTAGILRVMKKTGCVYEEEIRVFEMCLKRQLETSIFDLHEWEKEM